jgi:EmrB/QacA subfamily drug resistance transporter
MIRESQLILTENPTMRSETHVPAQGMHRFLILLCVSIPSFMINLDSNIVAVSLSSIAHSLGANFADIEWVISAYTLSFAAFLLPAGALADRYGRKRMLIFGLSIFTIASLVCGAAPTATVLNVARAFQGMGAAFQLSAALATLSHSFRGADRARAFAFWGAVIGIAVSLGPVVGGFITEHFGWEWAFYINIPIGIVMVVMVGRTLTESSDPDANKVDILGSITFSSSLFLLTLALISGNHEGWNSNIVKIEFVSAAILFCLFLAAEVFQKKPMLDLSIFKSATYVGATISTLAFAASVLTMLSYLPIFFQSGLGYSPQGAGLLMLPIAIPLFIVPRLAAAHLTHRFSGRTMLTAGLITAAAGLLWVGIEAPNMTYPTLLPGLLLMGVGAGILNGETAKVSMSVIPTERAGMGSGISGTVRFSGIVIGFAMLGAVLFSRIRFTVLAGLPSDSGTNVDALVRAIGAGDLSGGNSPALRELALNSFSSGYQAILFLAAILAIVAALFTWLLVRKADTAPTNHRDLAAVHAPVE